MTVQSIKITDASTNVTSYTYGDKTGTYQSIKAVVGESAAYKLLHKQSTVESVQKQWNGLSKGAKIGIACGVIGAVVILVVAFTAFCVVQRKRGKAEKVAADKEWNEHTNELMDYRNRMARGDFAVTHMGHGEKF